MWYRSVDDALATTNVHPVCHCCYPLVCVHCGPVEDFFIAKQTSLHPFDFVRNLFHLLGILFSLACVDKNIAFKFIGVALR